MPVTLTQQATERSTYVVSVTFRDETGALVTPSAVTWSLTNRLGNVVNSREDVSATPASTVFIVLTGNDLALPDAEDNRRWLTVSATYNSSTHGNGLALRDEIEFRIANTRR